MKSFRNHLDPEKEEQLKTAKIAVENKVKKILKLAKGINGNKDGNSKKKSEIVHLIEDFHQHYESLYSLYEDLKREVKSNISGGDDTPSSSSSSSSDSYYSPEESVITNAPHGDDNQDSGTSDAEDTVLKVTEAASSTKGEVARLKLEIETLSSMNRHWEERADEAMQVREEKSRLEGRVLELEGSCKERESQVKALNVEKGELEERLSLRLVALQRELASANDQKSRLEWELQKKSTETLEDEDGQTQISRLQASLSESEKRVSTQQKKLMTRQNELESLRNERNTMHKEMEALKNDEKRHFSELLQSKSKMERRNNDLTEKIADQQETLLELGDAIRLLKAENEKLARTYRQG